ncbi:MAG TPA: glycine cleavage system protein H [Lentisphaeria bacterium]|nr:glycine cleavage system protein H [Lentisphaeria bacterium]
MLYPEDLSYSADQPVWVRIEGDVTVIGITDDLEEEFQDADSIELPEIGDVAEIGRACATVHIGVEVYEILAPVSGHIVQRNESAANDVQSIFSSSYEDSWLFKIEFDDHDELETLVNADEYASTQRQRDLDELHLQNTEARNDDELDDDA